MRKILIPYVIWSFVYVVINNFNDIQSIPAVFVMKLITATAAVMMYYVFVYCEFTLLIPLIDKLARSKFYWIGFIISPLEIITMRMIPKILGIEINQYVMIIMHLSCVGWFIYFYLGYLIGNDLIKIKVSPKLLTMLFAASIAIRIAEEYWYLSIGDKNYYTQLKLSTILTGVIISLLVYTYVYSDKTHGIKVLQFIGDRSFGIFFSHIAVMTLLKKIPYYQVVDIFPISGFITLAISLLFVTAGGRLLGKNAKYIAF